MANSIHPTAIVSDDVRMGSGNSVGPFAVITGPATIGNDNWIGAGVVIGAPPEVRAFDLHTRNGELAAAGVTIGNRNVIREYAQVHQGWQSPTTVADDTFIMNQVYVAHDCRIGSDATIASSALLAGHVSVGMGVNVGLGASVHQRVSLGALSMVGMGSVVTRDVLPLAKAYGNPARIHGANALGMRRRNVPEAVIECVVGAYGPGINPAEILAAVVSIPELTAYFEDWVVAG